MKLSDLSEGMRTPETLNKGKFVLIDDRNPKQIHIELYKDKRLKRYVSKLVLMNLGDIWTPHQSTSQFYKHQGYGPLLYDLAIEYATTQGSGVVPATGSSYGSNTPDSEKVWKYYYERRSDIQKEPYSQHPQREPSLLKQKPWLFTIYRKKPIYLTKLKQLGRLINLSDDSNLCRKWDDRERVLRDKQNK